MGMKVSCHMVVRGCKIVQVMCFFFFFDLTKKVRFAIFFPFCPFKFVGLFGYGK